MRGSKKAFFRGGGNFFYIILFLFFILLQSSYFTEGRVGPYKFSKRATSGSTNGTPFNSLVDRGMMLA